MFPWSFLESLPDLLAAWPVWRDNLHHHYLPFKTAFLKPVPDAPLQFFPSIDGCGAPHQVVTQPDGSVLAVCSRGSCSAFSVHPSSSFAFQLEQLMLLPRL